MGALDGVDAAAKQKVNANNKTQGVVWEKSYANAAKTRTYCIYRAPSENAVREAAKLNGLPVDVVIEIPHDIKAEPRGAVHKIATGNHRYLVRRAGVPNVTSDGDRKVRRDSADLVRHGRPEHLVLGVRSREFLGGGERRQGKRRAVRVDRRDSGTLYPN